jgi:RNA polymerase primary sigma factor
MAAVKKEQTGFAPALHVNPTDLYWREIKDAQPLSREQEVALFERAHAGDEDARERLIVANLRFVVSVAREYKDYGLSLIELISEGNVGLLEAIKRFDETRGFKFITYAVWWIRQAMLRALAEHGKAARPPMSQVNDLQRIEKESGQLAQTLGRAPTYDEILAHGELSAERIHNALVVGQQDLSLDGPAFPDEETPLHAVFLAAQEGVAEQYERGQFEAVVRTCLEALEPREYQILRAYFGLEGTAPMTLEEIGEAMGVTRERIRQLRNRALEKMRMQYGDVLMEFSRN